MEFKISKIFGNMKGIELKYPAVHTYSNSRDPNGLSHLQPQKGLGVWVTRLRHIRNPHWFQNCVKVYFLSDSII